MRDVASIVEHPAVRQARAELEIRLAKMPKCQRCGRRHGEAIMGYPDGSWYSTIDGYHHPDGRRFQGAAGRADVETRLAWVKAGRTALVVVAIDKQNLCERCRKAVEQGQ